MEEFTKLIKRLTEIVQNNKTLDGNSFDLVDLARLSKEQILKIKAETVNIQLIQIDFFWDLTEEIYKVLMLNTINEDLCEFFKKLQREANVAHLKFVYKFSPWNSFTVSLKDQIQRKEFVLNNSNGEEQIQKLLNLLDIKDRTWIQDLYDFDYSFNFQSQIEWLFQDLAMGCWQEAKKVTRYTGFGFISESSEGSHIMSMDNGDELTISIEEYLSK